MLNRRSALPSKRSLRIGFDVDLYAGVYVGWDCAGSGCWFAVIKDELDRDAGRELDSHDPPLLTAFKNAVLLAVDAQQPMRLGVANFLESGLHSVDLLCVD